VSKRTDRGAARINHLPSPPAVFKLRLFGETVQRLTGNTAYLVGSVLERADYRDVDVRLMLDDETFERTFGGDGLWISNGGLTLANMALSALAREMTGLDVDCQVQRLSDANTEYGERQRQPLLFPPTTPYTPVTA
jgi:hypothetical protein